MAFTVRVIGIFTGNARSSATVEQRRARLLADLTAANQAWNSGFAPGVRCGIRFISGGTYNFTNTTIPGSTVANINDSRIVNLINRVRTLESQRIAIYVVYLSGPTLSSGAIGNGGPQFTFFNSTADYGLVGHAVLTDIAGNAFNRYTFAHEAGHVLFGRFVTNAANLTIRDPSNPGSNHNNNPQNLMFGTPPSSNPFITSAQCITARRSKVILENAAAGANARRTDLTTIRWLNFALMQQIRKTLSPGNRKGRKCQPKSKWITRKKNLKKIGSCCSPAMKRGSLAKRVIKGKRNSR